MVQCFCCVLLFLLAACEKPLKLPYIPPQLHNWPQPYKGIAGLRLHIFETGQLELPTMMVYRKGSPLNKTTLEILAFVIVHPRHGLVLFGTGLNRNIAKKAEPDGGGTFLTTFGTFSMAKEQNILAQLQGAGLQVEKVRTIILPDLRFDHTGEVESFPNAQIVVTSAEHAAATAGEERFAVEEEFDGIRNWKFVNFADANPLGTFAAHQDLFGDGSILLIDGAGVTAGGLAALVRLPSGPVLLCGNLAWTREQYFYVRPPRILVDREAWWEKAWQLKKFVELAPELLVFPNHEWAAVAAKARKDIVLHSWEKSSQ